MASTTARLAAPSRRGAINLRIEDAIRDLIDATAEALGKNRTEFMVEAARRQAIDVLLDQRLFHLDETAFDAFSAALDDPPPAGERLKSLMKRTPPWKL